MYLHTRAVLLSYLANVRSDVIDINQVEIFIPGVSTSPTAWPLHRSVHGEILKIFTSFLKLQTI